MNHPTRRTDVNETTSVAPSPNCNSNNSRRHGNEDLTAKEYVKQRYHLSYYATSRGNDPPIEHQVSLGAFDEDIAPTRTPRVCRYNSTVCSNQFGMCGICKGREGTVDADANPNASVGTRENRSFCTYHLDVCIDCETVCCHGCGDYNDEANGFICKGCLARRQDSV